MRRMFGGREKHFGSIPDDKTINKGEKSENEEVDIDSEITKEKEILSSSVNEFSNEVNELTSVKIDEADISKLDEVKKELLHNTQAVLQGLAFSLGMGSFLASKFVNVETASQAQEILAIVAGVTVAATFWKAFSKSMVWIVAIGSEYNDLDFQKVLAIEEQRYGTYLKNNGIG